MREKEDVSDKKTKKKTAPSGSPKFSVCQYTQYVPILTREQQDQADGEEIGVLSQARRVHAEVGFAEFLYVPANHFVKGAAPGPGNRGGPWDRARVGVSGNADKPKTVPNSPIT